jgi:hypothetical protein
MPLPATPPAKSIEENELPPENIEDDYEVMNHQGDHNSELPPEDIDQSYELPTAEQAITNSTAEFEGFSALEESGGRAPAVLARAPSGQLGWGDEPPVANADDG